VGLRPIFAMFSVVKRENEASVNVCDVVRFRSYVLVCCEGVLRRKYCSMYDPAVYVWVKSSQVYT
jgi:hypothetical protein